MHGSEGTLHQICTWITQEFGYEVAERRNWKNTVSASLSAGEQFVKGEEKEKGSGSIWRLVQNDGSSYSGYNNSTAAYPKHSAQYHHQHLQQHQQQQASRKNHTSGNNPPKPDDRTRVGYLISSAGEAEDMSDDYNHNSSSNNNARNSRSTSVRSFGNPGSLLEIVVDVLRRHDGEGSLVEILRWTRDAYPQMATLMDARTWDDKVHDCLKDRANVKYFVQQHSRDPYSPRWILQATPSPSDRERGTVTHGRQQNPDTDDDWGAAVRGEDTDDIYFGSTNTTSTPSGAGRQSHQSKPDCTTWSEKIDYVLVKHGGEGTATEICEWIEQTYPEGIVGKENWRRTVSASLSTDEGILKCPPRWGEKAAVWRLKSMFSGPNRSGAHTRSSNNSNVSHSSSESEDSHSNSDSDDDEEAHALLSFVRSLSSGSGSSSDGESGKAKKASLNKMSIQTMLNESFDSDENSSDKDEEDDSDAGTDDEQLREYDEDHSEKSSSESEEEEESEDDERRRRTHNRPTRRFGGFGRTPNNRSGSGTSKKYNSISWPEKITAVMLKYGGGQGRAGDICKWIQAEYVDDIDDSKNWKNTVSAFLSNNKRFIKGDPQGSSRAAVWRLSTTLVDDVPDSPDGEISSRKRRRGQSGPVPVKKESSLIRGGAVTRSVARFPPAKRQKFEPSGSRRSRNHDASSDEDDEDHLNGNSDGFLDGEPEKKDRSRRGLGSTGSHRATKPQLPDDSPSGNASPIETSSSPKIASKLPTEQKKMWPDRIEEVLLKHGGQGMAHEIHRWIEEDFMEDTIGKPGWKNLVSAHLSSNKKFVREQRAGKQGGVWILRSKLNDSKERRQPVALISRNNPSPSPMQPSASPLPQPPQRIPYSPVVGGSAASNLSSFPPLEDDIDETTTTSTSSPSSISNRRRKPRD
jgi:hypothetical protein